MKKQTHRGWIEEGDCKAGQIGVHKTPTTALFARLFASPGEGINLSATILHGQGLGLLRVGAVVVEIAQVSGQQSANRCSTSLFVSITLFAAFNCSANSGSSFAFSWSSAQIWL
jgi:hypothetical protein